MQIRQAKRQGKEYAPHPPWLVLPDQASEPTLTYARAPGHRGAAASRRWGLRGCAPADTGAKIPFNLPIRALYQERNVKPRRAMNATRFALVWLSRWCDWRQALTVVKPETFTRWHRQGFRLFWRWKSQLGRPPIPEELRALIRQMARENPTWGQERIANELLLKLGLRVSPRTVRKYMPKRLDHGPGTRGQSQRWATFVRNHAQAIVACDFCMAITATFRILYVFVVIEHARRRLLHVNVTTHPTAAWTLQQLHEAIPSDHRYRFLIHDRDSIFSHSGPTHTSSGSQGPQDPCAYARSECDLRTRAGDATPRMLGLCDSSLGKPSAPAPHAVGPALQCRSSSYVPGAGSPAIVRIITGTSATPSASAPGISACGVISNLERVASRI